MGIKERLLSESRPRVNKEDSNRRMRQENVGMQVGVSVPRGN